MSVFRKYKLKFKIDNRLGLGLIFASQNSGLKLPLLCRAKASPGFLIIRTFFFFFGGSYKAQTRRINKNFEGLQNIIPSEVK